jgi:hypothetical protein
MAEVLVEFEDALIAPDGTIYHAHACGREAKDGTGRWEGWIEFIPANGGKRLRTQRETTQPNRKDTAYWATGLSSVYLQGALDRTLDPGPVVATPVEKDEPAFDGPAPSGAVPLEPTIPTVLNPFSVYRKSEALLRNQLGALSAWHLVNIIRGYELSDLEPSALERAAHADLLELIVASVKLRADA